MQLMHYSRKPLTVIRSTPLQEQIDNRNGFHKPKGLWVSPVGEQDWKSWCTDEQWGLDRFVYGYEIFISAAANIIRLSSGLEIDQFHNEYARPQKWGSDLVSWPAVCADYDGILIAPYQWSRRLDGEASGWYYGWDCASGCIWNADAISSFKLVETQAAKAA